MKSRQNTLLEKEPDLLGKRTDCLHCGTPFIPPHADQKFCCTGCEYVSALIRNENLEHFYELKNSPISPIQSRSFEVRNYDWILETQKNATPNTRRIIHLDLAIEGISCFGCVWLIEKIFEKQKGAGTIRIFPATGVLSLQIHQEEFDGISFAQEIQKFGYILAPRGKDTPQESNRLRGRLGLCAAFALNNMLFSLPFYLGMGHHSQFSGLFHLLIALLATLSMAVGGSYFILRAVHGLRLGMLHMDLPISIGICTAYIGSLTGLFLQQDTLLYFDFVSIFIFLMLLGRWAQEVNVEKNQNRLLKTSLQPTKITRISKDRPEVRELIHIDQVLPGDILEIRPGEMIPVAGTLLSESSSLNLAWILGESDLRDAKKGHLIPSGATHAGKEPIQIQAFETWQDSLLFRLMRQQDGKKNESPMLRNVLKYYILSVIILATASALYWAFALNHPIQAIQVFVSMLIVSCPCALGLSYPLINEIAVLSLQKIGLFVRHNEIWGKLRHVTKIIFDKTGTLTIETPILQNRDSLSSLSGEEIQILFDMVSSSFHPVSRSLREELLRLHPSLFILHPPHIFEEVVGFGLKCNIANDAWSLGRPSQEHGDSLPSTSQSRNSCLFTRKGKILASFSFSDTLKKDAVAEVRQLRQEGYNVFILSGDTQSKLDEILVRVGLPSSSGLGAMTPDEKAQWIRENASRDALMIGDGANDSLAFDQALCAGAPVVQQNLLEQKADFYFVGNNLGAVRSLLATAKLRQRALVSVFIFAIAYNVAAGAVCLTGWMNPFAATVFMPLSSVISLGIATFGMRKAHLGGMITPALQRQGTAL